jgi:hypothetical protein
MCGLKPIETRLTVRVSCDGGTMTRSLYNIATLRFGHVDDSHGLRRGALMLLECFVAGTSTDHLFTSALSGNSRVPSLPDCDKQ